MTPRSAASSRRILFIGPRADTAPYFLAADVFAMTSREDPCPIANLEAMESGLAVVAFQESGGPPRSFGIEGSAVPYLDVEAMAVAVAELLSDPAAGPAGPHAQDLVRERFTWWRFMTEFFQVMTAHYDYHPSRRLRVSVIVPNYHHAEFLEARLKSVFAQTLPPHEIIFLDNASPDDSVEVAQRLAPMAPAPMRMVVNEENNGSTFLQWMKGLSLATGDLVWIAESDDQCRPEFLQRLVPEFYDPDIVLAYAQSALIGSEGEPLADTFLDHTDDVCRERWRLRFSVSGLEEVERALSLKNTIPNASAVVFRRPPSLDFADELAKFRFAGDWLFYAMQLRAGKIAYLPESLNLYRRHDKTVTRQSILGDTHAEETLQIKARIFETFPISAGAIVRSLWQSVMEYNFLTDRLGLKRPAITAHPKLAGPLQRIRAALEERHGAPAALRVLLVVDSLQGGLEAPSTSTWPTPWPESRTSSWSSPRPKAVESSPIGRIDERVLFLEGTAGMLPWPSSIEPPSEPLPHDDPRRLAILGELIRFHRIDVIHSRSRAADRLVLRLNEELGLPWFVHAPGDIDPDGLTAGILGSAKGVFYEHERELSIFDRLAIDTSARLCRLLPCLDGAGLVGDDSPTPPEPGEELRFFVAPAGVVETRAWDDLTAAVRIVNALPIGARGHRRARLVLPGDPAAAEAIREGLRPDDAVECRPGTGDPLAALASCHVALLLDAPSDRDAACYAIAALACGRPVIAADRGAIPEIIAHEGREAGMLLPLAGRRPSIDPDRLVTAILAYLKWPKMYVAYCHHARQVFGQRFSADQNAEACIEAYLEACNVLTFPGGEESPPPEEDEAATLPSRRFA